jgi:hypothetical protein
MFKNSGSDMLGTEHDTPSSKDGYPKKIAFGEDPTQGQAQRFQPVNTSFYN